MLLSELKYNEHSPKLLVLVGLPGSGKSTWVKKYISKHKNFIVISVDDAIEEFAVSDGTNYNTAWKKYISDATAIMKQNLQSAYNDNISVIVDKTNLTVKSRNRVLSSAPPNYIKIAVIFQIPSKELYRRLEMRKNDTGKSIPADVMDNFIANFIPPTISEGFSQIIKVNE